MNALQSSFTVADWIVLAFIAMVPLFMALGIHAIRKEMRRTAQHLDANPMRRKAKPLILKTTEAQRQQWRQGKQRHPHNIIDLMDDIDTLLKRAEGNH